MACETIDLNGYSSDSTYCSLFENSEKSNHDTRYKARRSESTYDLLNEILEVVRLHMQGKHLMGIHEVQEYMKQLNRIPLKTNKHHFQRNKLKSILYKIYKQNKMFEKSISCSIDSNKDPILDCGLTQDFQMIKENQNGLRPMFLPVEVESEPAFFGSDMLSNKMFISHSTDVTNSNYKEENLAIECKVNPIESKYQAGSSSDMFLTEEKVNKTQPVIVSDSSKSVEFSAWLPDTQTIIYQNSSMMETETCIETCSQETLKNDELFKIPPPKASKKRTSCSTELSASFKKESFQDQSNSMNLPSNENLSNEASIPQTPGDELTSLALEITSMQQSLFPMKTFSDENQFPEGKIDPRTSYQMAAKLGSAFHTCYNDKIAKLHCDVGNKTKSWDQIQEELDYMESLAGKTSEALSLAFDNIHIQEKRVVSREYRMKIESNFHGFNEEDLKALEWDDFLAANEARLDELSMELKMKFIAERQGAVQNNYFEDGDYSDLDWRNYNKD